MATFFETITEAVRYFEERGFDDQHALDAWVAKIRASAESSMTPIPALEAQLKRSLGSIYERLVDRGGLLTSHMGLERWTLQKVKPSLRAELDRRMAVSRSLIKLNRDETIEKTIRRFAGWATSIPAGGSPAVDKKEVKEDIRKALAQLPFVERRCMIDQGHKMIASINEIVASDNGAIAVTWRSKWRQPGYDYRPDHKERDGKIYLLRDSWAAKDGLVKPNENGYYDDITKVGEEVFCQCSAVYIYTIKRLPDDMLTAKGLEKLGRS